MRGSITVLINQTIVDANYDKLTNVFKAQNRFNKLLNRSNTFKKENELPKIAIKQT